MGTHQAPSTRPHRTDLPAPANGMNLAERPSGVILGLVIVAVLIFATSIIPAVFTLVGRAQPPVAEFFAEHGSIISLFSFGIGLLVLWLWLRAKERRRFSTLGFDRLGSPLKPALRGAGIGAAMIVICVLVPVATGQAALEWAGPSGTSLLFIAAMLLGFIVQGATEEILTRGYLTQVIARRWGLIAAVVVQAAVFTLIHGLNPGMGVMPIVNLIAFALFASLMSLAEGGLWGVCALHGVWNWAQGNVFGVAVSGQMLGDSLFGYSAQPGSIELLTGGAFGIEGSIITTLVYGVGAVIAWRVFRRKLTAQRAEAAAAA